MPKIHFKTIEMFKASKNGGSVISRMAVLPIISAGAAAVILLLPHVHEISTDFDSIFFTILGIIGLYALFGTILCPLIFVLLLTYGVFANLLPTIEKSWIFIAFLSIFIALLECFMWYFVIVNDWFIAGLNFKIEWDVFLSTYLKPERVAIFTISNFFPRLIIPKFRAGAFLLKFDAHPPPIPNKK